jgi:hypothetical protein
MLQAAVVTPMTSRKITDRPGLWLFDLPDEVLTQIVRMAGPAGAAEARKVNRQLRELVDDKLVWKAMGAPSRIFTHPVPHPRPGAMGVRFFRMTEPLQKALREAANAAWHPEPGAPPSEDAEALTRYSAAVNKHMARVEHMVSAHHASLGDVRSMLRDANLVLRPEDLQRVANSYFDRLVWAIRLGNVSLECLGRTLEDVRAFSEEWAHPLTLTEEVHQLVVDAIYFGVAELDTPDPALVSKHLDSLAKAFDVTCNTGHIAAFAAKIGPYATSMKLDPRVVGACLHLLSANTAGFVPPASIYQDVLASLLNSLSDKLENTCPLSDDTLRRPVYWYSAHLDALCQVGEASPFPLTLPDEAEVALLRALVCRFARPDDAIGPCAPVPLERLEAALGAVFSGHHLDAIAFDLLALCEAGETKAAILTVEFLATLGPRVIHSMDTKPWERAFTASSEALCKLIQGGSDSARRRFYGSLPDLDSALDLLRALVRCAPADANLTWNDTSYLMASVLHKGRGAAGATPLELFARIKDLERDLCADMEQKHYGFFLDEFLKKLGRVSPSSWAVWLQGLEAFGAAAGVHLPTYGVSRLNDCLLDTRWWGWEAIALRDNSRTLAAFETHYGVTLPAQQRLRRAEWILEQSTSPAAQGALSVCFEELGQIHEAVSSPQREALLEMAFAAAVNLEADELRSWLHGVKAMSRLDNAAFAESGTRTLNRTVCAWVKAFGWGAPETRRATQALTALIDDTGVTLSDERRVEQAGASLAFLGGEPWKILDVIASLDALVPLADAMTPAQAQRALDEAVKAIETSVRAGNLAECRRLCRDMAVFSRGGAAALHVAFIRQCMRAAIRETASGALTSARHRVDASVDAYREVEGVLTGDPLDDLVEDLFECADAFATRGAFGDAGNTWQVALGIANARNLKISAGGCEQALQVCLDSVARSPRRSSHTGATSEALQYALQIARAREAVLSGSASSGSAALQNQVRRMMRERPADNAQLAQLLRALQRVDHQANATFLRCSAPP